MSINQPQEAVMKYRVGFSFSLRDYAQYFTEWFDTLDEAKEFALTAGYHGIFPNYIEDENGDVV
jgi:hypothetical protein